MPANKTKEKTRPHGKSIISQSEERQVGNSTFVRVPAPVGMIVVEHTEEEDERD